MPGQTLDSRMHPLQKGNMLESLTLMSVAEIDELSEGIAPQHHFYTNYSAGVFTAPYFDIYIYFSVFILSNSDEAGSQKDLPDQNQKC